MVWIVAFAIVTVAVAALTIGSVLHPVLYGLLIAGITVIPFFVIYSLLKALVNSLFGRRDNEKER